MTLRTRLFLAFLALALVPTAILSLFTLDRLDRAIALWNPRGVELTLESALEVSKTAGARMEATAAAQAQDWALALPPESLTTARRTGIRAGLRASGLDFVQLYRREGDRWRLIEEVLPEAVMNPEPLDLSSEIEEALRGEAIVRSNRGILAAVAPMENDHALTAGMRVPPSFFAQVQRVGEGIDFFRRFSVVRDVSRTYVLLLVAVLALALTGLAFWVARRLARSMTQPLLGLETALERVASGDLETRIEPAGATELRTLAQRFNAMTERLAAARAALAEAEREAAWREVARRLAHEFKNVLTPLSLSLHRLRRRSELVPPEEREAVRDSLAALTQGVADLTRLAEQFSQYARLPEPRFERLDLAELTRTAARQHEPERRTLDVRGGTEPLPVAGDRLLLSRAVHNLVLNALEASPPGGTVELRLALVGNEAVLEVLDRGSGVAPDVRDRVFEPYVSTKARGSGLGLALVREIVTQHGGTVTLVNRNDGGACARLAVPLMEDEREAGAT
ncbi:MAG TPA: ATP-binding protein [Candidatus Limnocylindria bacterium]|nr:ATP-binding protein [Candidatus Limnocylindria bacterium]